MNHVLPVATYGSAFTTVYLGLNIQQWGIAAAVTGIVVTLGMAAFNIWFKMKYRTGDNEMNWFRSWTLRGVLLVLFVAAVVLAVFTAPKSEADANPQLIRKTPVGHLFIANGEKLLCSTQGHGSVSCITENKAVLTCDYRSPPIYFVNCRKTVGI